MKLHKMITNGYECQQFSLTYGIYQGENIKY